MSKIRDKIVKMIGVLAEVFKERLTEGIVKVYIDLLSEYSIEDIEYAFKQILKNETKFPVPAVFIKYIENKEKTEKEFIFNTLLGLIERYGSWYEIEDITDDNDLIETVKEMGGWRHISLLPTRDLQKIKHQFIEIYNRKKSIRK